MESLKESRPISFPEPVFLMTNGRKTQRLWANPENPGSNHVHRARVTLGTRLSWFRFDCARAPEIVMKRTSFKQPIRFGRL